MSVTRVINWTKWDCIDFFSPLTLPSKPCPVCQHWPGCSIIQTDPELRGGRERDVLWKRDGWTVRRTSSPSAVHLRSFAASLISAVLTRGAALGITEAKKKNTNKKTKSDSWTQLKIQTSHNTRVWDENKAERMFCLCAQPLSISCVRHNTVHYTGVSRCIMISQRSHWRNPFSRSVL